jgi:hypothetical protein
LQTFLCVSDIPSLSLSWHWDTETLISRYFHVTRSLLRKSIQSNRSLNRTYLSTYTARGQIVPTSLKTLTSNKARFLLRLLSFPLKLIPLGLFFFWILYRRVCLYIWLTKHFLSLENYMKEANEKQIYVLSKQHRVSAVFSNFYITLRLIRNLRILSSVSLL